MRFWSLGRSGLFSVSGRPSLRVFRAAVASCGAPKLVFDYGKQAGTSYLEVGLQFMSGPLFRCIFSTRPLSWRTLPGLWYHASGRPRWFKPGAYNNPISNMLNRSLFAGSDPRPLRLWERALLALGF
jgi:hypothetical protein